MKDDKEEQAFATRVSGGALPRNIPVRGMGEEGEDEEGQEEARRPVSRETSPELRAPRCFHLR